LPTSKQLGRGIGARCEEWRRRLRIPEEKKVEDADGVRNINERVVIHIHCIPAQWFFAPKEKPREHMYRIAYVNRSIGITITSQEVSLRCDLHDARTLIRFANDYVAPVHP
jgi:hypothetical protein